MRTIWCSLRFYLVCERRSHTSFSALHPWVYVYGFNLSSFIVCVNVAELILILTKY